MESQRKREGERGQTGSAENSSAGNMGGGSTAESKAGGSVQEEVPFDSLEDALAAYGQIPANGYMLVDLSVSSIPFLVTGEMAWDGSCYGNIYHYENGDVIVSSGFLNFGAGVSAAIYVDYYADVIGFFDSGSDWREEGYFEYLDGTFFYIGDTFNGEGKFVEFIFDSIENVIAAYNR